MYAQVAKIFVSAIDEASDTKLSGEKLVKLQFKEGVLIKGSCVTENHFKILYA